MLCMSGCVSVGLTHCRVADLALLWELPVHQYFYMFPPGWFRLSEKQLIASERLRLDCFQEPSARTMTGDNLGRDHDSLVFFSRECPLHWQFPKPLPSPHPLQLPLPPCMRIGPSFPPGKRERHSNYNLSNFSDILLICIFTSIFTNTGTINPRGFGDMILRIVLLLITLDNTSLAV